MQRNPIWLVSRHSRPTRLEYLKDRTYRQTLSLKMVFVPQSHEINLDTATRMDIISPYHFRGRPVLAMLLGVTIGILVGGIMELEPIVSGLLVATFAISTMLFDLDAQSEHYLARVQDAEGKESYIILAHQDIPILKRAVRGGVSEIIDPEPGTLTEDESRRVTLMRYGVVTTLSATSFLALARVVWNSFAQQHGSPIISILGSIICLAALGIAATGAIRIIVALIRKDAGPA